MNDSDLIRAVAEDLGWKCNAAHELIEVLRGEGWTIAATWGRAKTGTSSLSCLAHNELHIISATAPTFCLAVAEAFLKCRGKWKE